MDSSRAAAVPPSAAGFGIRLVAFLFDLIVIWVLSSLLSPLLTRPLSEYIGYVVFAAYFVVGWSTLANGRTLGMRLRRIAVIGPDGKPIDPIRAMVRLVSLVGGSLVLFIGVVWILFDARAQGWHDKLAGTFVIHVDPTASPATGSGPTSMAASDPFADAVIVVAPARARPWWQTLLAVAAIAGFGFIALATYTSMQFSGPGQYNCIVATEPLRASPSSTGHWEFRPPTGSRYGGDGTFYTERFTVGANWTVTWSSTQGLFDVDLYDATVRVDKVDRYTDNTIGRLEQWENNRKAGESQYVPSSGTRNLDRPGTYCLTISSGFAYDPNINVDKLTTDWLVLVEEHR